MTAASDRYAGTSYRRVGRSGVLVPPISLGLWQNFGHATPFETQREIVLHAFDRGVTHFDLANNYGPPPGSAERGFGRVVATDLAAHRDELLISTKAGYDMWPGPHGEWGSRKHLLASLDQSLHRMGLEYMDVFYSHRFDPDTPLEETMGALHTAVTSGKALYAGVSSYSPARTREAVAILQRLGTPLLVHQPSYSMVNRWIEEGLLDVVAEAGAGVIAFSPLAQGLLTDRYRDGVPPNSRGGRRGSLLPEFLSEANLGTVRALRAFAATRGQSLSQMAIAWALRRPIVASVIVGASSVEQLDENLGATRHLDFSADELRELDGLAIDLDLDLWRQSRSV